MWAFFFLAIVCLIPLVWFCLYCKQSYSIVEAALVFGLGLLVSAFIVVPGGMFLAGITTGAIPNYSDGIREGYITKLSVKGFIWKTNEAEIQVGTGNMSALQEPFAFCIPDGEILNVINNNTGKKVRIHYKQWLVIPFSRGESPYEAYRVEVLE